ncbi:MAG: DUF4118 domain-containing protein [Xanthobacteraceae bacterium]|jgi:hypothetical protein|nr:DUF4118 domain-containing protein [Xanthobacteraceae bacterium]MBV9629977.1 DUF4118 domain-containing protein [Xanthobacteraceae bacterium]
MSSEERQEAISLTSRAMAGVLERVRSDEARAFGTHTLLALGLVAATTLAIAALTGIVDLRHILAIYFVPVLAATLLWGFLEGIATAFISALAASFFFYDPIFSFYVANPVELVGLLIFVAAAIVIGYLATELREVRRAPATSAPVIEQRQPARLPLVEIPKSETSSGGTVPERVKDFIVQAGAAAYCDGCIQDRLGLKWRQQVQLITATLAVTDSFRREPGSCSGCGESKQVIHALIRKN